MRWFCVETAYYIVKKYILSWYSVLEISNACWVRQGLLSVAGLMCAVGMADNMNDWYPPLLVSVLQLILNGQKLVAFVYYSYSYATTDCINQNLYRYIPTEGWCVQTRIHKYASTVGPRLFESPLSEPSVIWTLFWILKSLKMPWFSTKLSNKWNACMFLRLVRLIIS